MRVVRHAPRLRHARRALPALALALLVGCDAAVLVRDPGRLEVQNWLVEDLVAWVGGRPVNIPACSAVELEGVELRGVRITSGSGRELLPRDRPDGPPIGPRRYIVVGGGFPSVIDLRTRPNRALDNRADCTLTVEELHRGGVPIGG